MNRAPQYLSVLLTSHGGIEGAAAQELQSHRTSLPKVLRKPRSSSRVISHDKIDEEWYDYDEEYYSIKDTGMLKYSRIRGKKDIRLSKLAPVSYGSDEDGEEWE